MSEFLQDIANPYIATQEQRDIAAQRGIVRFLDNREHPHSYAEVNSLVTNLFAVPQLLSDIVDLHGIPITTVEPPVSVVEDLEVVELHHDDGKRAFQGRLTSEASSGSAILSLEVQTRSRKLLPGIGRASLRKSLVLHPFSPKEDTFIVNGRLVKPFSFSQQHRDEVLFNRGPFDIIQPSWSDVPMYPADYLRKNAEEEPKIMREYVKTVREFAKTVLDVLAAVK